MMNHEIDDTMNQFINTIIDADTQNSSQIRLNPYNQADQAFFETSQSQYPQNFQANNSGTKPDNLKYNTFQAECPMFMDNPSFNKNKKISISQEDKLSNLLNDQTIRKSIIELITQHGKQICPRILKLEIISNDNYELDEQDIYQVFSRFGQVTNILLKQNGKAYIYYADIISALFAQKALNGYYIPEINVKLAIVLCNSIEPMDKEDFSKNSSQDYLNSFNNKENVANMNLKPLASFPPGINTMIRIKYTCKYEIQIENDKEFQVARKIIGANGSNMKRIIEICHKQFNNSDGFSHSDILKLRLRGRGSGFKEGPEKRESEEALHLCVSSKYLEIYDLACKNVEELLTNIYNDYKLYCQKHGRRYDSNLKIKRTEAFGRMDHSPNSISCESPSFDSLSRKFDRNLTFDGKSPRSTDKKLEFNLEASPTRLMNESFKDLLDQRGRNLIDEKHNINENNRISKS